MEMINGTLVAAGLDRRDPKRIKSAKELIALINKEGFLPLTTSSVAGFSVEERAAADYWFTDHKEDPWLWREIIAESREVAYGKLLGKKSGFISKAWFPTFANYRRLGYDFDSLYEDGKAHYRAKLIMDLFAEDFPNNTAVPSYLMKEKAGFGKGGEKGFEGTLQSLQAQTYLVNTGFTRKQNRKGEAYGWSISVYEPPESLFGEEYVRSEYSLPPEESFKKIINRMKELYPDADERDILKEIK